MITVVVELGRAARVGDDTANTPVQPVDAGTTGVAAFNQSDVAFAQGMIPHHRQAIAMTETALDRKIGTSSQVRDLATPRVPRSS